MSDEANFRDLFARVRAGNEAAATELVRLYEPEIRRAVRVRLARPELQRLVDSADVCQSVLANFFARAAAGQFDLESPEQLLRLLTTMARHHLADQARKHQAARRDVRRDGGTVPVSELADPNASPSVAAACSELAAELRRRLTHDERVLAELRAAGRDWNAIATDLNENPDALRKRLARGIDRVARELGLSAVGLSG